MNKRFSNEPYIRYANVYEDAETLLKLVGGSRTILSIASGGDNCLALLTAPNIKSLTIFDRNPAQFFLTKLKFFAIKYLDYDEVLLLLGLTAGNSLSVYEKLRQFLDAETLQYFDGRRKLIEKIKLVNCGKFEFYLNKIRTLLIRFTQSKRTLNKFMNLEISAQKEFYIKKICNLRWRFITKIFFSKKTVAKLGRDKANFKYAGGDLHKMINDRLLLCFDNVPNRENIYLQYTLFGRFIILPYYLQRINFDRIKANVHKAEFILGDLSNVFASKQRFDFFNLSDIFEYMSAEETLQNEFLLAKMANSNAIVVFWNMLVDRRLTSGGFSSLDEKEIYEIYKKEKAYYYQALRVFRFTQIENLK